MHRAIIADRHPLKQGLKPKNLGEMATSAGIADRHPLKQGLKRHTYRLFRFLDLYRRPTSTKTRIETMFTSHDTT